MRNKYIKSCRGLPSPPETWLLLGTLTDKVILYGLGRSRCQEQQIVVEVFAI